MDFVAINEFVKSCPEIFHWIISAVMLGTYTHLFLAFKMVRNRIRPMIKLYLTVSTFYVFFWFLGKFSADDYTMLDIFLPLYLFHYFSSLLILQARFFNCMKNGRFDLFDFNSEPKKSK